MLIIFELLYTNKDDKIGFDKELCLLMTTKQNLVHVLFIIRSKLQMLIAVITLLLISKVR